MPGLRPGLLQKYEAAVTADAKFAFLRAFLLDPENLSAIEVESSYEEQAMREDQSKWVQLPLSELRKIYTSEEQRKFLQSNIVDQQTGENHPQDPQGLCPEMMLYWHFNQNSDTSGSKSAVGTKISVKAGMPNNKAAVAALADSLTSRGAGFQGKGKGSTGATGGSKGQGKKGGNQRTPKAG